MRRLLAAFLVASVLIGVPFLLFGDALDLALSQERLLSALSDYRSFAWAVALALLLSDILLPIPNSAVMAVMGMLYGPLLGGAISGLGLLVSGLFGYAVCRALGRPAARRLVGARDLEKGEAAFARAGGLAIILSRPVPILAEAVACLAGIAAMPAKRFALALACGVAPYGFLFAAAGYYGRDLPLATLALCALAPLPFWYLLERRFRDRPADADDGREGWSGGTDTLRSGSAPAFGGPPPAPGG
jgi:uncharacterized membrane protein YdjX (TVP38/TMEM64 family)